MIGLVGGVRKVVVVISIEQKRMTFTIFGFVGVGLAILVSFLLLFIDTITHGNPFATRPLTNKRMKSLDGNLIQKNNLSSNYLQLSRQ